MERENEISCMNWHGTCRINARMSSIFVESSPSTCEIRRCRWNERHGKQINHRRLLSPTISRVPTPRCTGDSRNFPAGVAGSKIHAAPTAYFSEASKIKGNRSDTSESRRLMSVDTESARLTRNCAHYRRI